MTELSNGWKCGIECLAVIHVWLERKQIFTQINWLLRLSSIMWICWSNLPQNRSINKTLSKIVKINRPVKGTANDCGWWFWILCRGNTCQITNTLAKIDNFELIKCKHTILKTTNEKWLWEEKQIILHYHLSLFNDRLVTPTNLFHILHLYLRSWILCLKSREF